MISPSLSVVIPSLDGAARLPATLASIAGQSIEGRLQVVVVDDGSTDCTHEVAESAAVPGVNLSVVRHDSPRGRAEACNSGIAAAVFPIVVILDDDMTLEPGALQAHAAFHSAEDARAAIGKIVQTRAERESSFARFLEREEANRERQLLAHSADVPFPLCLTGHFSVNRDLLARCGGFDTRIRHYGLEDIELAYRLSRNGVKIAYLPAAVSRHRAYMSDLPRYLERHHDVGLVARQLAEQYTEGPFRDFLRVDAPARLGIGRDRAGLVALRISNRLLLHRSVRRALGSWPGQALLRGALRVSEALGLDRLAHFGYHVARDLRYFEGYFEAEGAKERS